MLMRVQRTAAFGGRGCAVILTLGLQQTRISITGVADSRCSLPEVGVIAVFFFPSYLLLPPLFIAFSCSFFWPPVVVSLSFFSFFLIFRLVLKFNIGFKGQGFFSIRMSLEKMGLCHVRTHVFRILVDALPTELQWLSLILKKKLCNYIFSVTEKEFSVLSSFLVKLVTCASAEPLRKLVTRSLCGGSAR